MQNIQLKDIYRVDSDPQTCNVFRKIYRCYTGKILYLRKMVVIFVVSSSFSKLLGCFY